MNRGSRIQPDAPDLKAAVRARYDAYAGRYNRVLAPMEWLGMARIRRRLLAHARGDVLEVAVGTGVNLRHYPPGCRLTGVDLSAAMMERAAAEAASLGLDVELRPMDAERLEFEPDTFDTVVCTLSTCTFPHPVRAMAEMARVVRPDGQVLLIEQGLSDRAWVCRLQALWAERQFRWLGCQWLRQPHEQARMAGLTAVEHQRRVLGMYHVMRLTRAPLGGDQRLDS